MDDFRPLSVLETASYKPTILHIVKSVLSAVALSISSQSIKRFYDESSGLGDMTKWKPHVVSFMLKWPREDEE